MSLETLTEEWYKARKLVLDLYSETDTWMKEKGKGTEVTELPITLADALKICQMLNGRSSISSKIDK